MSDMKLPSLEELLNEEDPTTLNESGLSNSKITSSPKAHKAGANPFLEDDEEEFSIPVKPVSNIRNLSTFSEISDSSNNEDDSDEISLPDLDDSTFSSNNLSTTDGNEENFEKLPNSMEDHRTMVDDDDSPFVPLDSDSDDEEDINEDEESDDDEDFDIDDDLDNELTGDDLAAIFAIHDDPDEQSNNDPLDDEELNALLGEISDDSEDDEDESDNDLSSIFDYDEDESDDENESDSDEDELSDLVQIDDDEDDYVPEEPEYIPTDDTFEDTPLKKKSTVFPVVDETEDSDENEDLDSNDDGEESEKERDEEEKKPRFGLKLPKLNKKSEQDIDKTDEEKSEKRSNPRLDGFKSKWGDFKEKAAAELKGNDPDKIDKGSSKELATIPKKDDKTKEVEKTDGKAKNKDKEKNPDGKVLETVKRPFLYIAKLYHAIINFIFSVLEGVLGFLGKIPIIGWPFRKLKELTKILRIIANAIPIMLLIGLLVLTNTKAVPKVTTTDLPDNGKMVFTDFSIKGHTANGTLLNTGDDIGHVNVSFDVYATKPTLNPVSWFKPKKVGECTLNDMVVVDIDGTKKVSANCTNVSGIWPRAVGHVTSAD